MSSVELIQIPKNHPRITKDMSNHYSAPKGFVGRSICYAVCCAGYSWGTIVGGSAIMHLKGRDDYFSFDSSIKQTKVQELINNIFFHIESVNGKYPLRNFAQTTLQTFREVIYTDWIAKYNIIPIGFECLVELPRTGEVYKRDGWSEVGQTIGYTCKREADPEGVGTDSWSGRRVWNMNADELRPKRVFCRGVYN